MRIRKFKLDPEHPHSHTWIGISCHLRDYRMAYYLNQATAAEFRKLNNVPIFHPRCEHDTLYSFYFCNAEQQGRSYYLIANHNAFHRLSTSHSMFDYFLIIYPSTINGVTIDYLDNIKKLPEILMVSEINPDDIKNRDLILYDIEMHMLSQIQKIRKPQKIAE